LFIVYIIDNKIYNLGLHKKNYSVIDFAIS